jgi:hypothetical protein
MKVLGFGCLVFLRNQVSELTEPKLPPATTELNYNVLKVTF